jgi:hypothetical protein
LFIHLLVPLQQAYLLLGFLVPLHLHFQRQLHHFVQVLLHSQLVHLHFLQALVLLVVVQVVHFGLLLVVHFLLLVILLLPVVQLPVLVPHLYVLRLVDFRLLGSVRLEYLLALAHHDLAPLLVLLLKILIKIVTGNNNTLCFIFFVVFCRCFVCFRLCVSLFFWFILRFWLIFWFLVFVFSFWLY